MGAPKLMKPTNPLSCPSHCLTLQTSYLVKSSSFQVLGVGKRWPKQVPKGGHGEAWHLGTWLGRGSRSKKKTGTSRSWGRG